MQQEQKSSKTVRVGFKLIYEIEVRGESHPIILTVCQVGQVFTIMGFLITNSIGAWQLFGVNLSMFLDITDLVLAIFSLVVMLILLTVFLIDYRLYNQLGTLQKFKGIVDAGNITCAIAVYTVQFFYYILGIYLFWKMGGGASGNQNLNRMLLSFGPPLYILQSVVFINKRPYALLSVLISPLLVIFSMSLGSFLLFVATMVIRCHHSLTQKLLYTLVGCSCIWCFIQMNYNPDGQFYLSSINLILIIGCCIGIFFFYPIHTTRSALQDDRMLLNFYKLRKNVENTERGQHQQINLEEEQMYETYFQETNFLKQVSSPLQSHNSPFQKWKKDGMERALWGKIKWDKQNHHTSFDMNLFYFSAGLYLKKNVLGLMREMIDYFQKNKSGYNFAKNYQMYKVSHQIFKSYQLANLNNDSNFQISDIIQAEKYYHNFYRIIKQLIQQLIAYWKELAHMKFLLNPDIENQLCRIVSLHQQLQQLVKQLQGYPIDEELRLFDLISKLVNNYQTGKDIAFEGKIKIERLNTFESLVLEGEIIEKMSLKLLRQLNYQRIDMESHSVQSLLPYNFYLYLEEIYRGFLERDEHSSFVLPLLHSNGCFVLKRCMVYMLPPSDAGVKLLLTLQIQKDNSQFFLYNTIRQRIDLLNDGLRQLMGIAYNRIRMLLNGEQVFFVSDLFQLSLSTGQMDTLVKHDMLKTKVVHEGFFLKKNHRFNYNNEVTLNLQHQFKFQEHDYKVINVVSESFKQFKIEDEQRAQGIVQTQSKERNIHEEYAHEVFFCRIQNPYKSKIVQKISNIHNQNYRSYFYQVTFIKSLLFIVIMINLGVFRYFNNSLLTDVDTITQTMSNLNNEYINLLRLYSSGYSNVLFTRNPTTTKAYLGSTFFSTSPPDSTLSDILNNLTDYYDAHNDIYSKAIKSTYLLYKNLQGHSQQNYQLNFSNFNIATNTQFTNFYDFIVAVEEGFFDSSDLPFFTSNYNSILSIMPVYEQYSKFSQDYGSSYFTANVTGFVFMAAVGLLVSYGFFVTCNMIQLHRDIKRLYNFIDRADVDKVIQSLISIKTAIGTISHQDGNNQAHEQIISKRQISQSRHDSHKGCRVQTTESNQADCRHNMQNTCRLMLFCPILLIYTGVMLYFQRANMATDQINFLNILNLLQKFQTDEMLIQRNYIDLFQPTYYQELYGPYKNPYQNGPIVKNHFQSDELPFVFQNDINKEESLCQSIYLSNITIPFFSLNQSQSACASIQSGVLLTGYSSSLEMFQSNIRTQIRAGFNNYLSPKVKGTMNNMLMIIFTRQILTNFLKVKQANFLSNLEIYQNDSVGRDSLMIAYGLCAAIGVALALMYNVIHLKRQMNIVINLVCIIPNSAMFSIRMTSFIRKEAILAKIDQL